MKNYTQFVLDPRLEGDTVWLASWPVSEVLLMNDSQYPWVILVPRRISVSEIYQLSKDDQKQLLDESIFLGETLMRAYSGEKLNVAALGNVVNQLHLHHVIRFSVDKTWPAPVWGQFPPIRYEKSELDHQLELLKTIVDKHWD